jgi:hypothetical protein
MNCYDGEITANAKNDERCDVRISMGKRTVMKLKNAKVRRDDVNGRIHLQVESRGKIRDFYPSEIEYLDEKPLKILFRIRAVSFSQCQK